MLDVSHKIHPSSVVEDGAKLGAGVVIGPFCRVGPQATLGDGVHLISHAVVAGDTDIGARTRVFPFASVGHEPQDLKYGGEPVTLTIGSNCVIREGVTLNPGTEGGGGTTTIGNNCAFLANSHVAHDCRVGNNVVFSNNVMLAGHCVVGDNVIFGGGCGIHQFCRVGRNAFVAGLAGVGDDIIPFGFAQNNRAFLVGLNLVGMKRAGIARESIHAVRAAFKQLFSTEQSVSENAVLMRKTAADPLVLEILDFVDEGADRPLCTPQSPPD